MVDIISDHGWTVVPRVVKLPASAYRARPWRNGAGSSDDIEVTGDAAAPDYALSETTISADCGFSDYSGYDRTIALISGNGFELSFADGERAVIDSAHPIFSFDGGRRVRCRLIAGPVRALNAISARERFTHTVEAYERTADVDAAEDETVFIHASDTWRMRGPASAPAQFLDRAPWRVVRIVRRQSNPRAS